MTADLLKQLHTSLDRRMRPEDLLHPIEHLLGDLITEPERRRLVQARTLSNWANPFGWSSMTGDFQRPEGMARQLSVASTLFRAPLPDPHTVNDAHIGRYLQQAEEEIGKRVGESDFLRDRLNREARQQAGLELSKRQYNKRFRLAGRLERKRQKVERELEKRALTLISKSRLASELPYEDFARDARTAAFIAYYTARCHVRSEFTIAGQARAYDEIADLLFRQCRESPSTHWWAIAQVYPDAEVLSHLTEVQRGELLGRFYAVLERTARLMQEVWAVSNINRDTMIVRRGNDSTTWNLLAGAWNKARDGWMAALYALDADEVLDAVCPGKALRLMAGDVAWWHQSAGGGLDPNTVVWSRLPLPWEVLLGDVVCTRATVSEACRDVGLDPQKSGWVAPRDRARVAPFRPTPELVHGVSVGSPALAKWLRDAGAFSGRPLRQTAH
ncbi:hypothetical protein [Deinococcus hohokamensis]|uniref:Uncharacterized protein n=1 Tax=Deinococcus hohokamensis TaxID=309883 RepID=A0ABV9I5U3_9DEIO